MAKKRDDLALARDALALAWALWLTAKERRPPTAVQTERLKQLGAELFERAAQRPDIIGKRKRVATRWYRPLAIRALAEEHVQRGEYPDLRSFYRFWCAGQWMNERAGKVPTSEQVERAVRSLERTIKDARGKQFEGEN